MSTRKAPRATHNQVRNQVRIGGGQWRGRKLSFPDVPGLRPTPDRVRETLFNWLAPVLAGSRCLDLFAGSGALGFEAASRGAAEVVLVERDATVVKALREQQQRLAATQIQIVQADALQFLGGTPRPFDIVLLDPPFGQDLLEAALAALTSAWLAPTAFIYLEAERAVAAETLAALLPDGFELFRSKTAGQVGYHLARRLAEPR
ncbi:MAG: 16S rRNA (guanine(966)-N(2))-methyltransferase RsmD [Gammaproteobacteria bacterium]|nr:16S rRNA (guanine(966)-N(2))-methyltransferase RsmD [Gammaproteobacteria bacterium]